MFFCENQILNQKWIIIFVFQPDPIRTSVYRSKERRLYFSLHHADPKHLKRLHQGLPT